MSDFSDNNGLGIKFAKKINIMNEIHKALYILSCILFLSAVLGGTLMKPVFRGIAERNLDRTVLRRSSIDSLDDKVDETFYKVTKIQMQVDKIKNIFSSDNLDESKYQKEKHEIFQKNIYNPLLEILIFVYRAIFFTASILIFMSGVIMHMRSRNNRVRYKLKRLEERLAVLEKQAA